MIRGKGVNGEQKGMKRDKIVELISILEVAILQAIPKRKG